MFSQHLVHFLDEEISPSNQLFLGFLLQVFDLLVHISFELMNRVDFLLFITICVFVPMVITRHKIAVNIIQLNLLTGILTDLSLDLLHV